MIRYLPLVASLFACLSVVASPDPAVEKDLRDQWMKYENGELSPADDDEIANTIYFRLSVSPVRPGRFLEIRSSRPFFLFFNGQLMGQYPGPVSFSIDSLSSVFHTGSISIALYQKNINLRDLKTLIVAADGVSPTQIDRPATFFSDFVIVAGLLIAVLFVAVARFNQKLAADYLAVGRIFSTREVDDGQSNARLTNGSNVQFYVLCSLLTGYYLMIIFANLPEEYRAPLHFTADGFWGTVGQWIKLSALVLCVFFIKLLLIFSLTRLFDMRGLTRVHFFNWVRLMLLVLGGCGAILFIYFISRGQNPQVFVVFLTLVAGTLLAWIFIVFLKLSSRSEHSMFHLFSYICATELIPLLITIKVLFH